MFRRAFGKLMLLLVFVGFLSGCDNRPKYVLPSSPVPPARPPVAAGGGGTPANPAADAETREKLSYPKELPAEATPPEKKD